MVLIEVNDQKNFEINLKKHLVIIVMFSGSQCPSCKLIEPVFKDTAIMNASVNNFMIVNVQYFQPFQIETFPTFAKYSNEKMIDHFKVSKDWDGNNPDQMKLDLEKLDKMIK